MSYLLKIYDSYYCLPFKSSVDSRGSTTMWLGAQAVETGGLVLNLKTATSKL